MSIELNHTIVHVKDRGAAARDVGQVLGLPEARAYGPFAELKMDNAASLGFMHSEGEIQASTTPSSWVRRSLTLSSVACDTTAASGGPIPSGASRMRSTTRTLAAASTGKALTSTGWSHHPSVRHRRLISGRRIVRPVGRPRSPLTPWLTCVIAP
jgi:hypothetical protein